MESLEEKKNTLLKITGDLAVEQFTMQSQGDSKSQYLTCGVLTFTLTCASKSQYFTCEVLTFTGTCESIVVKYVEIGLSTRICIMVSSIWQKNSKKKQKYGKIEKMHIDCFNLTEKN